MVGCLDVLAGLRSWEVVDALVRRHVRCCRQVARAQDVQR